MTTTVAVASTIYNLAGDVASRTNYIQSLMAGAITGGKDIPSTLQQGYLNSPARRYRRFFDWSNSNGGINSLWSTGGPGQSTGNTGPPNFTPTWPQYWPPPLTPYGYNYTELQGVITSSILNNAQPLTGAQIAAAIPASALPPGYNASTHTIAVDTTKVDAYSAPAQGAADEWIAPSNEGGPAWFSGLEYVGLNQPQLTVNYIANANDLYALAGATNADGSRTIQVWPSTGPGAGSQSGPGSTVWTITVPAGSNLQNGYCFIPFTVTPAIPSPVDGSLPSQHTGYSQFWYFYMFGTGNSVLDQLNPGTSGAPVGFYPFIPVRSGKTFLSPGDWPPMYYASQMAFNQAFQNPTFSYDDLIAKLKQNSSLANIDYAYIVFGCSLNVYDNSCRKYVYKFFQALSYINPQNGSLPITNDQNNTYMTSSLYNSPNGGSLSRMTMQIDWTLLQETTGTGTFPTTISGFTPAVDQVWFETWSDGHLYCVWQTTATTWSKILFSGVTHKNFVYGATGTVLITAEQAIADTGEESGFIVPLESNIFNATNMKDATQMASQCAILVLNSYQIYKTPWYASGWFKVVLFIAAIVISFFTAGAGGIGLLGTNLAVGTAIGFTGTAAILAGAALNALAAMVLTDLITAGAQAVFGKALGQIIGLIASFVTISVGTGLQAGQNFSFDWTQLTKATTLLQMTNVVGQAFSAYVQGQVQATQSEMGQVQQAYSSDLKQIQAAYAQLPGYDSAIDLGLDANLPQMDGDPPYLESPDAFFNRTLMTGTDIAQLTMSMIDNFPELTLSTQLPILT